MPVIKCKCGRTTNTVFSKYELDFTAPFPFRKATECYIAIVFKDDKQEFVKGCSYEKRPVHKMHLSEYLSEDINENG